jgi:N-acetylmuramoyl-L-alanine amidase
VSHPSLWRSVGLVAIAVLFSLSVIGQSAAAPPSGKGKPTGVDCPVPGGAQVVLDPGHGGSDIGTSNGTYNLLEKNLTLDIAFRTQAMLENVGYTVALTRQKDIDLGNSERGEIANACGADIFIEIHLNGSSDPSIDYTQTFWGKKRKDLAFSQTMSAAMSDLGIDNNGVGQFANGGLLNAEMPSTLVEAVFLTNDAEAAQFVAGTRQNDIAAAITQGVQQWIAPR